MRETVADVSAPVAVSPEGVECAPVREHVRTFMSAAFVLDAIATTQGERSQPRGGQPAPDVETDWHTAALGLRVLRAMNTGQALRFRLHDDTAHVGRVVRLSDGPVRDDTTHIVELDTGTCVHLADVAAIAPAPRKPPDPDRRDPRLATCAHAFGYGGHCLTKSRRYSTTFKQLRADREAWVREHTLARSRDATQRALAEAERRVVMLEVDGIGNVRARMETRMETSADTKAQSDREKGTQRRGIEGAGQ